MAGRSPLPRGAARFRRRGRNAAWGFAAIWLLSQIVLTCVIQDSIWLRDPMFADKRARLRQRVADRTTAACRPLSVIVAGSSRTLYAVRGDVMEDTLRRPGCRPVVAVNFGIPAAGPVTNLLTVRRLVTSTDCPDVMVVEVLPPLLMGGGPAPVECRSLLPERLSRDELAVVQEFGFPADVETEWRESALLPSYGQRFALVGRVAHMWRPWNLRFTSGRESDATGWLRTMCERPTPEEYRRGIERARVEYRDLLQGSQLQSRAFAALRRTASVCREHQVPTALLLMPEGTEFRSWYRPSVEAELQAALRALTHDTGVQTIDARSWLGDECFLDSHHLIPVAAGPFSERLARAIEHLLPGESSQDLGRR